MPASHETGLKLESLADELPVKPKKEDPEDGAPRKAAAKKTVVKRASAKPVKKPEPKSPEGSKRSLVPQLPRKN